MLPAVLSFSKREETSPYQLLAKMPRPTGEPASMPTGPEADALIREYKARHYATWPDDHLPALDGLTPREAAAQPNYRARLDTLLKEMEYHESQEEPGKQFSFSTIRRELGM